MAAKTYTQYLEEILKSQQHLKDQKIKDANNEFDIQSENIKGQYLSDIANLNNTYDDYIDKSYVQKLIDKKQVEETMANMGLTDSGLNRTQQTAIQLSHSNRVANYNALKQQKIDSLAQAMRSKLSDIQIKKAENQQKIEEQFFNDAQSKAQNLFNKGSQTDDTKTKEWGNITNVLFDEEASSKEKYFLLEQYFLKYGFSDNEKHLLDKMNINYKNFGKPIEDTSSNNQIIYEITDDRRQELMDLCDKEFISKKEFVHERNLNNYRGTYKQYQLNVIQNWYMLNRINKVEQEYLIDELGLLNK